MVRDEAGKRGRSRAVGRLKPCYATLIFYYEDSTWVFKIENDTVRFTSKRSILLFENHNASEIKLFFIRQALSLLLKETQSFTIKKQFLDIIAIPRRDIKDSRKNKYSECYLSNFFFFTFFTRMLGLNSEF